MTRINALLGGLLLLMVCTGCRVGEPPETPESEKYAVDYWEMYKENCEDVLRDPYAFDLSRVLQCTKVWEMYRPINTLSVSLRSMYSVGFSRVYHESKGDAQIIAREALHRVCIPAHPMGPNGKVIEKIPELLDCGGGDPFVLDGREPRSPEQKMRVARKKARAPEIRTATKLWKRKGIIKFPDNKKTKRKRKKARPLALKCQALYEAGRFGHAEPYCKAALKITPYSLTAKYNLAKTYAALGEKDRAVEELTEMFLWRHPQVLQFFRDAKVDEGFKSLRADIRFKVMSGYRRTTLLNGAGEEALKDFERLALEIQAKEYDFEGRVGNDKMIRLYPIIYYRPAFKKEALDLQNIIGNQQTRLSKIHWNTRDDFIVVWGAPEAGALFSADAQNAPIVQGTPAEEEEGNALTNALDAVQGAKDQAGEVQSQGEGIAAPPEAPAE